MKRNVLKFEAVILTVFLVITVFLSINTAANKTNNQIDPDEAMPHYNILSQPGNDLPGACFPSDIIQSIRIDRSPNFTPPPPSNPPN